MSYCIEYNPELRNHYPNNRKCLQKKVVFRTFLALITMLAVYILVAADLVWLFVPGEPAVTTAAFSELVDQIGAGESVIDAMACFVRNVITKGMPS